MKSGKTVVTEVPAPVVKPGFVLVRNVASLVSAGTERMLVEFAGKNLVDKARARPDLVRQVVTKARRDGILPTMEAAFNRLDQPMTLGYSSAGIVVEVGEGVRGFQPGDRVACAGGGFAVHAEMALVPVNLLAHVPDSLNLEEACFATLGAIALHGFRLASPQIGDRVAVIGLGLLGLLASGIARSAGCEVMGVDLSTERVKRAQGLGYQAVVRSSAEETGKALTKGLGFDHILICADAKGDDPVELAAILARDKANVVAVGAVGLDLPRKPYYEKELNFIVSRSYGPGRYDPQYEEQGVDYPAGYVRWTEGRNLQAVVDLMAARKLDVHPLITHRFEIENAPDAYELITGKTLEPFLAVLITYPDGGEPSPLRKVNVASATASTSSSSKDLRLGVLGAGNYANATFLPVIQRSGGVEKVAIASVAGVHARTAADRFGFQTAISEDSAILTDEQINLVAILTRHDLHASQSIQALNHGKHVYCEKPVAITLQELSDLKETLSRPDMPVYTAGFNRRFAPLAIQMKSFLAGSAEPMALHYRVNAGPLPLTHWLHDPLVGGGRIIGEACHFLDLMTWLTGSLPVSASISALPDGGTYREDNVLITVRFADGSLGSLSYLANGDRSAPKEYLEVFSAGRMAILDDFDRLELWKNGAKQTRRGGLRQDKGHAASWQAFLAGARSGKPPIPYAELFTVAELTIRLVEQLRGGHPSADVSVG